MCKCFGIKKLLLSGKKAPEVRKTTDGGANPRGYVI